jgi:hypothetical protein
MNRIPLLKGMFLIVLVIWLCAPQVIHADVEWTIKKELSLTVPPLDFALSADEQWIFILTPGEIVIYSLVEDTVLKHIPVDQAYDRLQYSVRNRALILTSRSGKTLKIIQLEEVNKIDISGLPFKGPEHAPVTIAVFTDYQ